MRVVELSVHQERVRQHAAALKQDLTSVKSDFVGFKARLEAQYSDIVSAISACMRSMLHLETVEQMEKSEQLVIHLWLCALIYLKIQQQIADYRETLRTEIRMFRQVDCDGDDALLT